MQLIINLFWIGLFIAVAGFVFQFVITAVFVIIGGIAAGVASLFNKVKRG